MLGLDHPDDLARLVFLVVLGLGLLLVSLGPRRRMGRALRDLLVWALIFAMVVIAYGARDTLMSQLFPARTLQVSQDTVSLGRGHDGHFRATLRANGVPVRFIVDTGATGIVLSRRDAERIGIDPEALVYSGLAETANGVVRTAPVRIERLDFGGFTDRNLRAAVTEGALDSSLLGMSYLSEFSRIEIAGDRMILTR
jgi:aspartyl protease family protein